MRSAGLRDQFQGYGIDAVATARGRRPVVEDVTQMGIAPGTKDLGTHHTVAPVRLLNHGIGRNRAPEARPTGSGIEFFQRAKDRALATHAAIGSRGLGLAILAGKWPLGPLFATDLILLGGENFAPFRVAMDNFVGHLTLPSEFGIRYPGFADHRGRAGDNLYPEPWLGPEIAYNIFTVTFKRNLDAFPDLSIFTKTCPRCAADNAADSMRCSCGYVFDGSAKTDSLEAIEVALQEAELYAEYLKARLHQTREAAEVAASDLKRNPEDATRQRRAEESRAEYKITKTEYKLQLDQIATLKAEAEIRQKQEAAATQKNAWEAARKKAAARAAKAKLAAPAPRKPEKKPASSNSQDSVRPPLALREKLARKAQNVFRREKPVAKPVAPVPAARPKPAAAAPRPVPKARPAAKPVQSAKPSPRFREKQAAKVSKPRPTTMECPHCTTVVPMGTETCRCGYSFSANRESMPGIGLTSEEQARILDLFRHNK